MADKELTEWNGLPLKNGIWRDPYTRAFSLIGKERVLEVSNYPRAYEDTDPHIYDKDIQFVVAEDVVDTVAKE